MKCLLVLLVGILAACDAPRPAGAYTPRDGGGLTGDRVVNDGDADDADDSTDDETGDDTAARDSGMRKPTDAGIAKPPADAGKPPVVDPPATGPYARLAGRYLMRMDMYSVADATKGGNRLRVENRVSNLMSVTLSVVDDKLVSEEKLCFQTYLHKPIQGCTAWKTELDPALAKSFFPKAKINREYKIVDGTLTADEATLPLGFDATNPTATTPLPTSPTDPSVWKLAANNPNRVGVRTILTANLTPGGSFACNVMTVQRLVTSFTIAKIELTNAFALTGAFHHLEAGNANAQALLVERPDTGNTLLTQDLCTLKNFQDQSSMDELNVVSFKRFDDLAGCPTSAAAFEDMFPGSVERPAVK